MFLVYQVFLLLLLNRTQGQDVPLVIEPPAEPNHADEPQIVDNSAQIAELRAQLEASEVVSQIHGSMRQLSETARIRQQLDEAIHGHEYAYPGIPGGPAQDAAPQPPPLALPTLRPFGKFPFGFDLIKFLLGRVEQNNESAATLGLSGPDDQVGSVQGTGQHDDTLREFIRSSLEDVIKRPQNDSDSGIMANVVDSAFVNHVMGDEVTAEVLSKVQYRESLSLVNVTEDPSFTLGNNVSVWYTHNYNGVKQHTFVGVTDRSLILVLDHDNNTYESRQEVIFNTTILASTTFLKWNGIQMDKYVVLAIENEIQFVLITPETAAISVVWTWDLLRSTNVVYHFRSDESDALVLASIVTYNNVTQYSADIYRFNLETKQSWLVQKIPLRNECTSVHFLVLGNEYMLVFPQNDTVEIYRNSRTAESTHTFEHAKSIDSVEVKAVSCFQIGGLSYIAIGGRSPQILRYHLMQFVPQTILSTSWGLVEHILPINARTYRDDLILLIQHRVHFDGGHSVPALEALIWNGEAFLTGALSVPCYFKGVIVESGLSCILDYVRDVGIEGASVVQRGKTIALLVPRFEAPSGLYYLTFQLDEMENPNVRLAQNENRDLLEKLNAQTDVISYAETVLFNSVDSPSEFKSDWSLEELDSDVVEVDDISQLSFQEFWLGENMLTADDLQEDIPGLLAMLDEYTKELNELESLIDSPSVSFNSAGNGQFKIEGVRVIRERREDSEGQQQFGQMHVEDLQVEYINDIPVNEMIFKDANGDIDLSGSEVVLGSDLTLDGVTFVNEDNIVGDALDEENSSGVSLHVTGNVNVGSINGVDFNDFLRNVVLVNIPNTIENAVIEGTIRFTNSTIIRKLNQIQFPNGYAWQSYGRDATQITGQKTFTGELHTLETDIAGTLDGINPTDVFTLTDQQTINGPITFEHLEVNEQFDVTGKVSGRHLDDFLANPSLLETNHIQSDCIFNTLIVDGPVYVENAINGINLDAVFSDVVYKNNSRESIKGFKSFDSINVDQLQLSSGRINGIPVDDFLTINTDQDISIDTLSGNVVFKELSLNGLFDFINVTELDASAIRLQGDQYTDAELIFQNPDGFGNDFEANQLNILDIINDVAIKDLVDVNEPIELVGDVEIDGIIVENLDQFEGDLIALGVLNGLSLVDLERTRVSLTRRQEIEAPFFISNATIRGDLNAMQLNGQSVAEFKQQMKEIRNGTEDLNNGEMSVEKMIIEGSVNVSFLNGHDFEAIKSNAIWLDRPNSIGGSLSFVNPPQVVGQFLVDNVNGVPFNEFIQGIVRRGDLQNVVFTQPQTFVNGLQVAENMDASRIGNIDGANVLNTKTTVINGLRVSGNVISENVNVAGSFNGVPVQDISQSYVFDELRQAHVIRTPKLRFSSQVTVEDLWLRQDNPNITAFLLSVIRKDAPGTTIVQGVKEFQGKIQFQRDLNVDEMDDLDVNSFLNTVVLNEAGVSVTIDGDVSFEERVQASVVEVRGDIVADSLIGLDWTTWLAHGIRVDQPYTISDATHFGPGAFRAANVSVVNLNGIPMADVLTTNTAQSFDSTPHFSSITSNWNINVGGRVNNMDLREERANTVMTLGNQTITAESRFQNVRVLNSMQTLGPINGRDLQQIAPLDGDLNLSGPFSFGQISATDLQTADTISGINFNHWTQNALLHNKDVQVVTGNWTIGELHAANVDGSGDINGMDVQHLSERLLGQTQQVDEAMLGMEQHHRNTCLSVKSVVQQSQSSKYKLTHFEDSFQVPVDDGIIHSIHIWKWDHIEYMLINLGCLSRMYRWNANTGLFEKNLEVETGFVEEWLSLEDSDSTIIISNSGKLKRSCQRTGLNVWRWNQNTLEFLRQIDSGDVYQLNLNAQTTPNYFYAIHTKNHSVIEFDITGVVVDSWRLPAAQEDCENVGFVFLPERIVTELALSDGNHLSRLSPNRNTTSARPKRCFGKLCDFIKETQMQKANIHNNFLTGTGPFANASLAEDKSTLGAKAQTTKLQNPSFKNSSNNTFDMFNVHPKVTWPEWRLGGNAKGQKLGIVHHGPESEAVGSANPSESFGTADASHPKMFPNPEEVVMATPTLYNPDNESPANVDPNMQSVNILLPENATVGRDAGGAHNSSALNGTQPRMDLFGNIEQSAKKFADRFIDKMYGGPKKEIDMGYADDDADIETGVSANQTGKVSTKSNNTKTVFETTIGIISGVPSTTEKTITTTVENKFKKVLKKTDKTTESTTFAHSEEDDGRLSELDEHVQDEKPVGGLQQSILNQTTLGPVNTKENTTNTTPTTSAPPEGDDNLGMALFGRLSELDKHVEDDKPAPQVSATNIPNPVPTPNAPEVGGLLDVVKDIVLVLEDGSEWIEHLRAHNKSKVQNNVKANVGSADIEHVFERVTPIENVVTQPIPEDASEPGQTTVDPNVGGIMDVVRDVVVAIEDGTELIQELRGAPHAMGNDDNNELIRNSNTLAAALPDDVTETNIGLTETTTERTLAKIDTTPTVPLTHLNASTDMPTNGNQTGDAPEVGGMFQKVMQVVIALHEGAEIIDKLREVTHHKHEHEVHSQNHHYSHDNSDNQHHHHHHHHHNEEHVADPGLTPEAKIGTAVSSEGGVATAENHYLPGRVEGAEIITLEVGINHRRTLVAISAWTKDVVRGHQDTIKIYEDVIDGVIFQTIACHRPRSLATMRLRTETILVFLERDAEMRLFVYRGIEGFTAFTAFTMKAPVQRVQMIALPAAQMHSCPRHFLAVVMAQEVEFLEAIMSGHCGLDVALNCDEL